MRCFSVMPSRNSMTMKGCPACWSDFVDGADIGMIQRRGGLRFSLKAGQCLRVFGHVVGQKLQRDESVQSYVFGLVHHTHAAAAELFDNAVMRDGLADHLG